MINILYIQGIPFWRNIIVLRWTAQILSATVVLAIVSFFFINVAREIDDRDIPFGFSFLDRAAQIPIGESIIDYSPANSYLYGILVALLNTVKAAGLGVLIATILGIMVGVARLSSNWLLNKIALAYIEVFRNVPLLVQLLFWFMVVLSLPNVREGYVLLDALYINNSGLYLPWVTPQGGFWAWFIATAVGIAIAATVGKRLQRRENETGQSSYPVLAGLSIAVSISIISIMLFSPLSIQVPEPQGRFGRIAGGANLSGSFTALLVGLVIYTSSFIAEIVRAGIQSVNRGQTEASQSLGLSGIMTMRHVVFPQALRVIIPPMISQYLNLTKNSSLAAAIGYPDLVSVATTMTQTAPAVSLIAMVMAAYLTMSLFYSLVGNLYNRYTRIAGTGA